MFKLWGEKPARGKQQRRSGRCRAYGRRVEKAVWRGVAGCGAPSGRDMGAPAEWLGGGVGYTGKGRVEKEMMFLPGVCRRTAKAAEGAV